MRLPWIEDRMIKWPPSLSFVILGAISLIVAWRPLVSTFALAWRDYQYTHVLLVLPISLALIYLDWRALSLRPVANFSLSLGLLGLAALIAGIVRLRIAVLSLDMWLAISMLALVIWWIGAFVFCFGPRIARALAFPLCFLFALVPIPQLIMDRIVKLLQQGSAWAAHVMFAAAGIPVFQNGTMLTIPDLTVEVAKECSSIRSSSMLLLTSMVLAQLVLRSPSRKLLAILAAIPLSVAKNGLRIFTIAMLATRVDPSFLTGRLHRQGGIVFFAISLAAVCGLLWILRRTEEGKSSSARTRLGVELTGNRSDIRSSVP